MCRCQCGQCPVQDRERDAVCCVELAPAQAFIDRHVTELREEVECVTRAYGFEAVCIQRDVLDVSYTFYARLPGPHVPNRRYRYTAYRQLSRWLHGRMGRHHREVLPACCVGLIRTTFPSADGTYVHYQAVERT